MKALTLTQPWATLVALRYKHIETRSWSTRYRGPLAIHAAKGIPKGLPRGATLQLGPFEVEHDAAGLLLRGPTAWPYRLPRGEVVTVVELLGVEPITTGVGRVAGPGRAVVLVTPDERAVWVSTWPDFNADDLDCWRCSIFRNEGPRLSSELIVEAMVATTRVWGGARLPEGGWATWVDRRRIRSSNPGYCFQVAGWWRDDTYRPGYRQRYLIRLRADIRREIAAPKHTSQARKKRV